MRICCTRRPAFGGNIIATIVNPDHRPQMATVREGVMRKEYAAKPGAGEVKPIDWKKFLKESDLVVKILDRQIEERKINIKGASVVVAGGYGVGSKENFKLIHELAEVLGGEVGASVLRWTQVSRSMPARSVRRALRSVPNSTSRAVFRARSSIRPVWTSRR